MSDKGKLTVEDGKRALRDHVIEKGIELNEKYGPIIEYNSLEQILKDQDFARFPTEMVFDSSRLDSGMFGICVPNENNEEGGYTIYIHEFFKDKLGYVPMLVLYHMVSVNYGEFATFEEAEFFGASALGIEREEYYQTLCDLADQIPQA